MSPKQATVRFSAKGNNRNANQCTIYQTGKNPADQKKVGGQAVLGRQSAYATPWLTERHGYDPTCHEIANVT